MAKRDTPGATAHLEYHRRRNRLLYAARMRAVAAADDVPETTASWFSVGSFQPRSGRYPTHEVTEYLDSLAGLEGLRAGDAAAEKRFLEAMIVLAMWSEQAAEMVRVVCIEGRSHISLTAHGDVVKHDDIPRGTVLIRVGEDDDGDASRRSVYNWLERSWETIGLLILSPIDRQRALKEHQESRDALERLRAAGLPVDAAKFAPPRDD